MGSQAPASRRCWGCSPGFPECAGPQTPGTERPGALRLIAKWRSHSASLIAASVPFPKMAALINQHVHPAELIDGRQHESSRGGDGIGKVSGDTSRPAAAGRDFGDRRIRLSSSGNSARRQ